MFILRVAIVVLAVVVAVLAVVVPVVDVDVADIVPVVDDDDDAVPITTVYRYRHPLIQCPHPHFFLRVYPRSLCQ